MYRIDLTPEAVDDLKQLRKFDVAQVVAAIEIQLASRPTEETRNRKRLRPNALSEWELRVGQCRVFYDFDEDDQSVIIRAVGHKVGNVLYVHGEEYEL